MSVENFQSRLAFSHEIYHPRILFLFSSISFLLGSFIGYVNSFWVVFSLITLFYISGSILILYPRIWVLWWLCYSFGAIHSLDSWETHIYKENFLQNISGNYTNVLDISGTVLDSWRKSDMYRVYRLKIDTIDAISPLTSTALSLRIPSNLTLRKGEVLHWKWKINPLDSSGGMFRMYWFIQDVHASARLFLFSHSKSKDQKISIETIRESISKQLEILYPKDTAWLILWILIGNTDLIGQQIKDDFRISGLSHLLAVSGSNVGLLLIIIEKGIRYFRLPKGWRLFIISSILLFFMVLVGLDVPVIRATIMGIIIYFGFSFDKKIDSVMLLFLVMVWFCLYNPLSLIHDISCTLSFLATLSILIWKDSIGTWYRWIPDYGGVRESAIITTAATVGTAPYLLFIFSTFSPFSIVANILIWPTIGWIMILSLFSLVISYLSPYGAYLIWYTVYGLLEYTESISHFMALLDPGITLEKSYQIYTPLILIAVLAYFIIDTLSFTILRMRWSQKAYSQ